MFNNLFNFFELKYKIFKIEVRNFNNILVEIVFL